MQESTLYLYCVSGQATVSQLYRWFADGRITHEQAKRAVALVKKVSAR